MQYILLLQTELFFCGRSATFSLWFISKLASAQWSILAVRKTRWTECATIFLWRKSLCLVSGDVCIYPLSFRLLHTHVLTYAIYTVWAFFFGAMRNTLLPYWSIIQVTKFEINNLYRKYHFQILNILTVLTDIVRISVCFI